MEDKQAGPDWSAVREEYEERLFRPSMICKRHGISPAQLRYRREVEGWLSAVTHVPSQAHLVSRMLKVLEVQVMRLEAAVDEPIDKQVKALSESVKTLDTLIKNGATKPNVEPATRRDMTELRAKLVRRLEQASR
ncbi:hypothetical protein SAMN05216456_2270 [Devosia crocina]|uniref:Uncharacterized protein n=1 Tax=Devosia crocina TaxID=429728 RepID=A0A1I7NMK8_9HYPH|nr:hypothetical protein [Devosia crocina]SFV35901.1 hypothetical protein SAMN05216456_2270 [Devosia crocina]